jgi:hypothetical protein
VATLSPDAASLVPALTVAQPAAPEVLAAPLPNRLIEKGLPGVGLLVHLILSRYEDQRHFSHPAKADANQLPIF